MSTDLMTTLEAAEYLGINQKQVYALAKEGRIPATRATGKWLFPRRLLDRWLEEDALAGTKAVRKRTERMPGALLASGSNDPILDLLTADLRRSRPDAVLFTASTGSMEGLRALNAGYVDIAWSHLWDPETGEYNMPFLPTHLPDKEAVVVTLFQRELGFVTAPGNPRGIRKFIDLTRPGIRFLNRQDGSGTRLLLDQYLAREEISPEAVHGYGSAAFTHLEVGLAVSAGEADAGLATGSAARLLGLGFVPLTLERFDMVMSQPTFFLGAVQALLEMLTSAPFRAQASRLGSYDFSQAGKVLHS